MNKLVGFTYNKDGETSNYIYRRNLQSDIIGIYDSLGNEVGWYAYDAYGKCYVKYKDNSSEEEKTILNTNPFRYRGYYYDNETGLYYLNARYYDPSIGRFISPDVLTILDETKGQINGLNLYMYCNNNPVNYSDRFGQRTNSIWKTLLGVVIGIGLFVVTAAAVIGSGGVLLVPVLVGAGVGAGLNLVGQGISNLSQGKGFFDNINWGNVALGALSGAAFATGVGGLWGAVAIGATSNAGMSALEGNSWANIGFSALVGGAAAFAGFKLGKIVSNKLLNINTNLGICDYLNMARVDGAGFFSRSVVALMSKLYTMGPTIVTGVGRGVTKFVGNYIGDWFW